MNHVIFLLSQVRGTPDGRAETHGFNEGQVAEIQNEILEVAVDVRPEALVNIPVRMLWRKYTRLLVSPQIIGLKKDLPAGPGPGNDGVEIDFRKLGEMLRQGDDLFIKSIGDDGDSQEFS
jgi:hypothetical protein